MIQAGKCRLLSNSSGKQYFNPLLNVYYWMDRQQREVDFVITEGVEVRELIQVCYDVSDFSTKKREVENLVRASEKLGCDSLKVITWSYEGVEEVDGKKVEFVKAWKWFLSVES